MHVKGTLQTLFAAIHSLSDLIECAVPFFQAVITPSGHTFYASEQRFYDASRILGMGETAIEHCRTIHLARLDQYITFFSMEAEMDEDFRLRWLREMTLSRSDEYEIGNQSS
jgi:hypothetical protein